MGKRNQRRVRVSGLSLTLALLLTVVISFTHAESAPPTSGGTAGESPPASPPADNPLQPEDQPSTGDRVPIADQRFAVGIQVEHSLDLNPDDQNGWMDLVDQLNMDWIKQQVRWEMMEPEQGQIDWSMLDLVLPIAAEHNKKVLLSIVTAPDWAREPGISLDWNGPPEDPQDYADFVVAILERYPGMVHAIEVWNKPNIYREWDSPQGLKAENYIDLLRTTYEAIKNVAPDVIVISGGLSATGSADSLNNGIWAWDDFIYLDQLLNAELLNYADCIGVQHPGYNVGPSYTWDTLPDDPTAIFRGAFDNRHHSWMFRSTIQTYANKIELAGGDQKVCVTEFGWPVAEDIPGFATVGFEFALDNTLEEQKEWTVEALQNMEKWDSVWLAFIWNLNYGPQAGWAADNDNVPYSFIGPDFTYRPVYDAVQTWMTDYKERTSQ